VDPSLWRKCKGLPLVKLLQTLFVGKISIKRVKVLVRVIYRIFAIDVIQDLPLK